MERGRPSDLLFHPQGTQVKGLHYDWFTALELPFSDQRFAAPEYLARFGFLVDPKQVPTAQQSRQPARGFRPAQKRRQRVEYLDITCAACHTGELHFNGQALRIDGGSAQHVLPSSVPTLRGGSLAKPWSPASPRPITTLEIRTFARQVLGIAMTPSTANCARISSNR
jgi:hypothetical protein